MRLMTPHCTPHPGIYTPFWCPTFRQRGVIWAGMATSKAGEAAKGGLLCQSATLSCRSRGFRFNAFRPLRQWLQKWWWGAWWCLLGGVGQRTWRTVIELPTGACTNSLPLILPQFFVIFVVPLSPVTAPLLSVHCPSLGNALSWIRKKKGIRHKGQA